MLRSTDSVFRIVMLPLWLAMVAMVAMLSMALTAAGAQSLWTGQTFGLSRAPLVVMAR